MSDTLHIALISELPRDAVAPMAQGLAHAGHEVEVLAPGAGMRHLPHGDPGLVVHATSFAAGRIASHLKHAHGTPFVMSLHGDAACVQPTDTERRLVHDADALVCTHPQEAADLAGLYGADPERISIVPCGFDPVEFKPVNMAVARAALGLQPDEFIVLQVGRLLPHKGIANVIRAFAHLPGHVPARMIVVGGESTPGREIERLQGIAGEWGVADLVTFTGHRRRDELRLYYAAADVFVSTPEQAHAGLTPLEAMACGTPVVGSAVGCIRHSVDHEVSGFLVPPRDPVALAARLAELYDQPALARAMGRAGLQRARTLFTREEVTRQLVEVYRSVLLSPPVDATTAPAWTPLPPVHAARAGAP